ncbi:glutamate receptor ionotropic, kainate 3, partial [Anoplophora glabripennis]|uniref:glutamate receptor ionotropic, kainate 3 n=1 Tax=Anoplophora glabripennis TaxID=217634 RepID=UPI000C78D187
MKTVLQNVLWLVSFVAYQDFCLASQNVTIGVLLSEENHQFEVALNSTLHKKNADILKDLFKSNVKNISKVDSFEASKTLCGMLNAGNGVAAVISFESLTSAVQESICDHFEVPYIMTSWRPSTTRRTNTVVNFFPEDQLYAQALAEVVKSLRWSSAVILYESEEGLLRMRGILELRDFKHDSEKNNILVKQLGAGNDHRSLLKEIKNGWGDNIILDCKTESIIPFLKQAKDQNLLNSRNNYLLTSLDAHTLNYGELDTAANITTIRLFDYNGEDFKNIITGSKDGLEMKQIKTETVLFYDALQYITQSITHHYYTERNIKTNPISCHEKIMSEYGYAFAAYMKEIEPPSTLSGPIKFDDNGNRINFNMQVVDILQDRIIADWFASNQSLLLRRSPTVRQFLGNQGIVIVSSRLGEPYLMYRKPKEGEILYGNDRYEGYSLDLITEIAKLIGYKFEFRLTADGQYGQWNERNKKWSGLIGDILEEKADLAVCDLTITHQRREVVDFSMPFMTLGISILYTKAEMNDVKWFSFVNPFSISVWIYTAALYLIVSVVLYFISRITPGDWENPHPSDDHPEQLENIWDIKNCLWLTLASVMTQGCDILP